MIKKVFSKFLVPILLTCLLIPAFSAHWPQSDEEAIIMLAPRLQMKVSELKQYLTLKKDNDLIELVPLRDCQEHLDFVKNVRIYEDRTKQAEHMKYYYDGKTYTIERVEGRQLWRNQRMWGKDKTYTPTTPPLGLHFIVKVNGEIAAFLGSGPLTDIQNPLEVDYHVSQEFANKGYSIFAIRQNLYINLLRRLKQKGIYKHDYFIATANVEHSHAQHLYSSLKNCEEQKDNFRYYGETEPKVKALVYYCYL